MSRYFMIQSWVGSHENEPDYNGNQCGERNVRSSEVVPLYDQYGNANTAAFSDESIAAREVKAKKKPRSIMEKILPQQIRYDNLCNLMDELEQQKSTMTSEDYYQYHAILKAKIDRQWILLSKAAGWNEHIPVKKPEIRRKKQDKNNDKASPSATIQGDVLSRILDRKKPSNNAKKDFTIFFGWAMILLVMYKLFF